jgi:hypothetical protein
MKDRLTRYEQETIISYNKTSEPAHLFTYCRALQRHVEIKLGILPEFDNGFGGRGYKLPKHYITFPRKPRKLSATAKLQLINRAKEMNKMRQIRKVLV